MHVRVTNWLGMVMPLPWVIDEQGWQGMVLLWGAGGALWVTNGVKVWLWSLLTIVVLVWLYSAHKVFDEMAARKFI